MRLVVAVGVLACALAAPRIADACQCEEYQPLAIGPPPDSTVPPTPTFYIFAPNSLHDGTPFVRDIYITNVATSRPNNTIRTKQIAIDYDYIVYEVESDASEGVIELHMTHGDPQIFRYPISTREVPNRARPFSLSLQRKTDCGASNEKSVWITLNGNAAAYALEWDDGRKTIVPADHSWNGTQHDIRIGAACANTNVPFERLHELHAVTLRALFPDGRSRVLATSKLQLGPDEVRSPVELLDTDESFTLDDAPTRYRPERSFVIEASCNPTGATIAGGAAAGGLIVAGGALLRARRRRHQSRL
jgi:hypothetical protein